MGVIYDLLDKYNFGRPKTGVKMTCPFCGHKHLEVNVEKDLFVCWYNACDRKGGYTEFALEFYRDVLGQNIATKREAMELYQRDMGFSEIQFKARQNYLASQQENEPDAKIPPIEKRNEVYRAITATWPLKKVDEDELLSRGYEKNRIRVYGYVSLPVKKEERRERAAELEKQGFDLHDMAGFTEKDGRMEVADFGFQKRVKEFGYEGVQTEFSVKLIPVYDTAKNLQYFLIGWDKRLSTNEKKGVIAKSGKNYAKYTVFSTPRFNRGGKVKSECGFVGGYVVRNGKIVPNMKGQTYLPVIEGMLKTPLYRELLFDVCKKWESCIAQNGVSNYGAVKRMLETIKETCPEVDTIVDCYDMDRFENENVMEGSRRLKKLATSLGFKYGIRLWSPRYKGIDDYMLALKKGEQKKDKEAKAAMREEIFAYAAKYHLKKDGSFFTWAD